VVRELAEAMDRLAEDAGLANRIAANARRSAERAGFLWSSIIDKWLPLYERVRQKHQ
jgi:glycosyltransferase involved in cell wall biosynthesis